jgi:phosphatidylinositol 4-kinase
MDKMNYLMSVDISLSKPIFVRKSHYINKSNKEEKDKKYEKINEITKRKKSDDSMQNNNILNQSINSETSENNNKQTDEESINNDNKQNKINIIKTYNNNELYGNSNLGINIINLNIPKKKERKRSDSFEISADFSESSSSPDENNYNYNSSGFNSALYPLGLNQNTSLFNKVSNYGQTNINTFNILKKNQINNYNLVFGQTLETQEARLKYQSQYGYLSSYKVCKVLIKSGEDLRQEQFASQLINEFAQIFKIEEVDCYLYPYEIISTGNNAGIIEVCPNSISLDELKHKTSFDPNNTLKTFYENYFGKGSKKYKKAIRNLVRSLAGYSLVCYFLQIKDRHNGNILINNEGYLIQIDFGFFLSNAPGGEFEKAPFKLTDEVVEVIGGINSKYFQIFRKLMWKGMLAIAKHYEKIMILVEMMYCGYGKKLECFKSGDATLTKLRDRFKPKKNMKKRDYLALVDSLIHEALSSWSTKWYDKYQYFFEGIFY